MKRSRWKGAFSEWGQYLMFVMKEGFGCPGAADTNAAACSCNSSAWASVPEHLLRRQPATANKFQMGDWYNRSNDMKMLWDPLSHFTGVVSVALRRMFTSAISDNHIPQGNLDWMCTYKGLKMFYKREQIPVAGSDVSGFWPWSLFHSFAVFSMRVSPQFVLWAAGGGRVCVVVVVRGMPDISCWTTTTTTEHELSNVPDYFQYQGKRLGFPQSHPCSGANKQINWIRSLERVCLLGNEKLIDLRCCA